MAKRPMDNALYLENTAREFWIHAGLFNGTIDQAGHPGYPCDLKTAITLALPLELYGVASLRISDVQAWMRRVKIAHRIQGRNRRLHGCLVADRGAGTIFFDASDPDDEQRFTLAHELAHFLLDYQTPRQRALEALGTTLLPVLDGDRSPTTAERLHAAMSDVTLGTLCHFMERPDDGLPAHSVLDVESRADRLALELLAPAALLRLLMRQDATPQGFNARLFFLTRQLVAHYGLPAAIASSYARFLLEQWGEPTFRDWLLG